LRNSKYQWFLVLVVVFWQTVKSMYWLWFVVNRRIVFNWNQSKWTHKKSSLNNLYYAIVKMKKQNHYAKSLYNVRELNG